MYMPVEFEGQIRCDFCNCFYGMGLAGRGSCPGLWWWNNCPAFIEEDKQITFGGDNENT